MKSAWVLLCAFGLLSCNGSSRSTKQSAAETLRPAGEIRAPSKLESLTPQRVLGLLASENFHAVRAAGTDDSDACVTEALRSLAPEALGENLLIDGTADLGSCLTSKLQSLGIEASNIGLSFQIRLELSCPGQDLGRLTGDELLAFDPRLSCGSHSLRVSSRVIGNGYVRSGEYANSYHSELQSSLSQADGQPCQVQNEGQNLLLDGCVMIQSYEETGSAPSTHFLELTARALRFQKTQSDSYYLSGSFAVQANDWQGELNFTGADAAPRYTLSRGADTLSGELFGRGGFSLAAQAQSALTRLEGDTRQSLKLYH